MTPHASTVLHSLLRVLKPAARLLLRHGVAYPAFAAAMKRVFLEAAQDELAAKGMSNSDSAITLLSGVHRRDVRTLLRAQPEAQSPARATLGPVSEVLARWMHDKTFHSAGRRRAPRTLARGTAADSFDSLVASVSSDVRPRALLDELKRLGVAREDDDGVTLLASSFAPRQGFDEMALLFADNLHDHLAAASANLQGDGNFLEQSVFVDELTAASVVRLQAASVSAWQRAFKLVMGEAQTRFDADAAHAPAEDRQHRARFGVYFYSEQGEAKP